MSGHFAGRNYWDGLKGEAKNFRFCTFQLMKLALGPMILLSTKTLLLSQQPLRGLKAASDHLSGYYKTYQLPTLITNCSNNYGPIQFRKVDLLMIWNAP
jgi:dTDP-glucose 4,6-dehydratase